MHKLIDVTNPIIQETLSILLQDKTTGKNIIWATDAYQGIDEKSEMTVNQIMNNPGIICPRVLKSKEEQIARSRKKAEVFTPAWLVNKMNNFIDEDWFGRKNVFNIENSDNTWTTNEDCIKFKGDTDGEDYIRSRRLEITCGEAPYLATRYDAATGEIIPLINRVGILDRKLRVVCENTENIFDWWLYATLAFKSVYGYEYQGDNILITRINLLLTFVDYYEECFKTSPGYNLTKDIAKIIAKNIWQMDGLTNKPPFSDLNAESNQLSLFDCAPKVESAPFSRIFNHSENKYILFSKLKEMKSVGKKLFDYVIGNPPYQEDSGDTSDKPVYNYFMDTTYEIADKVMLITPARFLFKAGKTPKVWNETMLADEHLKVIDYEQDSSKIFPNTDIKGGVAVTYHDTTKKFTPIGTFIPIKNLRSIYEKVVNYSGFKSFSPFVYAPESFHFTNKFHEDNPKAESLMSEGHANDLTTNVFDRLEDYFFDEKPDDNNDYIQIYGLNKKQRVYKWIRRDYIRNETNLDKYKVILPKSNGSGAIGEVLSTPLVGTTQTFISIGAFDTEEEATACLKYIKTKFARTMLGTLKVTQDNKRPTWRNVPLQDFTKNSDIDWTKSVSEIDRMLYKKYGLSEEEIEFIETHVKEMM